MFAQFFFGFNVLADPDLHRLVYKKDYQYLYLALFYELHYFLSFFRMKT